MGKLYKSSFDLPQFGLARAQPGQDAQIFFMYKNIPGQ